MSRSLSTLVLAAVLATLLAGAACASAPAGGPASGAAPGSVEVRPQAAGPRADTLPAVAVATTDGAVRPLQATTAGRVALINFWASWCEACKEEIPALRRLNSAYAPLGVAVVGVNLGEPVDKARGFARALGMSFVQYFDEKFTLADALKVSRVPTTLVVDAGGRIVHAGDALDERSLSALRQALAASRQPR
jgi:thiol-disulfide isomerase/thioredoxin